MIRIRRHHSKFRPRTDFRSDWEWSVYSTTGSTHPDQLFVASYTRTVNMPHNKMDPKNHNVPEEHHVNRYVSFATARAAVMPVLSSFVQDRTLAFARQATPSCLCEPDDQACR